MIDDPAAPAPLAAALRELALDLRWTWSHEADALWAAIDPQLWEASHNPWALMQAVSADRLEALAADDLFVGRLRDLADMRRAYLDQPTWFSRACDPRALSGVAYFSMEFGLGAALPLYAGGLGVLAGDFLKAASDLGVPLTGVGLLYQEGYFRQVLDASGGQREVYPFNDPAGMPIAPALVGGEWLRVPIALPGRELRLRVWRAQAGRAQLLLLDSNDPLNSPSDRGLTAKLYDDDPEVRLLQEVALGVGGWRALQALGVDAEVCHMNEGHCAFAGLERARSLASQAGLTLAEALWASRPGNVFTTHTPVAAGFDRFDPLLVGKLLPCLLGEAAADSQLAALTRLGRAEPADEAEPFNMAWLAMRISGNCFAVSQVHQEVSRAIFQPLFPRWPREEVPVSHVTNGVHTPSWDSAEADALWTEACGKERWRSDLGGAVGIEAAPDEAIWSMRAASRAGFVAHVRRRLALQLVARGGGSEGAATAKGASVLDPDVLTLGFARRFTAYKRPNLLLQDPERLARILLHAERPVQIVLAGKAHPADLEGKAMIREWIRLAETPPLRPQIVFLEDYDLGLAQELVQGVDVWLNMPRRPWEACGTSGMKVLVNGGLNASVLDGWWAEAYAPDLGWSIGDGRDGEGPERDAADAEALYRLIEQSIAPEFYDRDARGLPRAWIARIRASMARLTARFGAGRMLNDYLRQAYLPAAVGLSQRSAARWTQARDLAAWSDRLNQRWRGVRIAGATITRTGRELRISAAVVLPDLRPQEVRVEAYAEPPLAGGAPQIIPLTLREGIAGAVDAHVFEGRARTERAAEDFTVRVAASHPCAGPGELPLIAWQR